MDLPLELIFKIAGELDSKSLHNLCCANAGLHNRLWENRSFWNYKCLKSYGRIKFKHQLSMRKLYFTFQQIISFGRNRYGELGVSVDNSNQQINCLGIRAKKVFAKGSCSFAIDHNNNVWGWGKNTNGQLGVPDLEKGSELFFKTFLRGLGLPANDTIDKPVKLDFKVKELAIGDNHTIFRRMDDTLWSCGINDNGQVGIRYIKHSRTPRFAAANVKKIAAGGYHSIYTDKKKIVWGCGNNEYWQIGTRGKHCFQKPVSSNMRAIKVAAGLVHTVIIDTNNHVWVTGYNDHGQLGIPTVPHITRFVKNGLKAKSIAVCDDHNLAIDRSGTVWVWGNNSYGQLGTGNYQSYDQPHKLAIKAKHIATGKKHSILIDLHGEVWVCGNNKHHQLTISAPRINVWTKIPHIIAKDVAAGSNHSLIAGTIIV